MSTVAHLGALLAALTPAKGLSGFVWGATGAEVMLDLVKTGVGLAVGLGVGLSKSRTDRRIAAADQPNENAQVAIAGLEVLVEGLQRQQAASDQREAALRLEVAELRGEVRSLREQLARYQSP